MHHKQGLAKYVQQQMGDSGEFRIVIGYDARHNSKRFAQRAATAFLAAGAEVILFSGESLQNLLSTQPSSTQLTSAHSHSFIFLLAAWHWRWQMLCQHRWCRLL